MYSHCLYETLAEKDNDFINTTGNKNHTIHLQ